MNQCKREWLMGGTTFYCVRDSGHDGAHHFEVDLDDDEISGPRGDTPT